MKLYWLSWYQPTGDHRPLGFPPNGSILGWWCTGQTEEGSGTLCSYVVAPSEQEARDRVRIDWPGADEWRFCNGIGRSRILPGFRLGIL